MKFKVKIPAFEVVIETVDEAPPPPPPPPSTIAGLPAEVLLYWSGGEIEHLAAATDGTGAVDGLSDASTVGCLADLSTHGRPLVQADPSKRPIAGRHPKGLGVALIGEGTRSLAGAADLSGARTIYLVATLVGADTPSSTELPPAFAAASQALLTTAGANDAGHSLVVGLAGTDTLWTTGVVFVDGLPQTHLGAWYRRRILRIDLPADASPGALLLLRDHLSSMAAQSWVHELVVLSGSATAGDHAAVEASLARHKATPVVACGIDSLTTGYGLTFHQSLVHKLARHRWRGCVSVPSLGVPGQMVSTALAADAAKLAAIKGAGINVLVLEGCANDLNNGALPETCWQRLKDYGAMATAQGFVVVLCSVPESPFWSRPDINKMPQVQALNTLMASEWQAAGFARFVNLGAPEAQGDGLHYTAAGVDAVAALVGAAVDPLLGP